jgi:isopentenyl diphosphate isomerase/L-lactate dehydrogenase-like FMN-dependent dehydrogenase
VKALALGAHAVLIGRATLYGVAAGGHTGAARAIALLREEIGRVMALLGARSVEELGSEFLHFTDGGCRRGTPARADLKLLDTARAAEG